MARREIPDQFRCAATRADGQRCGNRAELGEPLCWAHDPQHPARPMGGPPPPERRCTAHVTGGTTRTDKAGARCEQWTMTGQNVCQAHGGTAPQNRRAVIVRDGLHHARDVMTTYGGKAGTTPLQALLDEVQWTAGHVEWLRERVQEIASEGAADPFGEDPLVWGVTRRKEGGEDRGVTEEAAPSIWLKLYQQERVHLVRVCAEAIKAGLDERMVRLAENQGQMVVGVIRLILADLNLTAAQQALVPSVVPARLRELLTAQAALN